MLFVLPCWACYLAYLPSVILLTDVIRFWSRFLKCYSSSVVNNWFCRMVSLFYKPEYSHLFFSCRRFFALLYLKGQYHEIFCFWFFYESVSPQPQSIPLGPFQIFSKSHADIRSSRLTTGVADTGGKWKKIFNQKNFNNLVGTPLDSRVNIYVHFCLQVHFKVSSTWY